MMMASPLVARTPSCLSCIRRINQVGSGSFALTQIRGKKTEGRLKSNGVAIRLLRDLERYGKEGSIFLVKAGSMRNNLYPTGQAEYMTRERFQQLGLTKADIGTRDTQYGVNRRLEDLDIDDAVEHIAGAGYAAALEGGATAAPGIEAPVPAIELEVLPPNRALELLEALIPETIIFERHLIHPQSASKKAEPEKTPEPAASRDPAQDTPATTKPAAAQAEILSPLQRRQLAQQAAAVEKAQQHPEEAAAEVAADKAKDTPATSPLDTPADEAKTADEAERERRQVDKDAEELLKIHGSVSLSNIAGYLKEKMLLDPEASRIHVQPEEIRFVGLEEGVDQIKRIGSFEVEIRTHVGKLEVMPVRRRVEVVPV